MKHCIYILLMPVVFFLSCRNSSAPGNTSIDTGFHQTPIITDVTPSDSLHNMDTTVMVVDSAGNIQLDGMPVPNKENNVYRAVYNDWLQAYQKTNHLPLVFKRKEQGTVMMGTRGNITDAIHQAQGDMKEYISKDKYKKSFAELSLTEKDRLQQLHPILFQETF